VHGSAGDIADISLAELGHARIEWAERSMPVLRLVRERFAETRPLAGLRLAACMHVTAETGALMRTLLAGGAEIALAASNPLSTQDEAAAALVATGLTVYARNGVDRAGYYAHINAALDIEPELVLDDGCDLVNTLHVERTALVPGVRGGCEPTTSGVIRLRRMAADGALAFPMVAVNDSDTKRLFDNRYGTGQSTMDALLRSTNTLLAGRTVVVAGYGACGVGVAERARGLGAQVVVTEVNPTRALDAALQGYRVLPMAQAAPLGDVFVTVTGNRDVLRAEHFAVMRDGAVLANAGHFDVEIDVAALAELAVAKQARVRQQCDEYLLADGRRLLLVAEGRVANLAAAEGHPAAVMDMAFAEQALTTAWLAATYADLAPGVLDVPERIDAEVARLKLASMGIRTDVLSDAQQEYSRSWRLGS
jgi:adenosylhomocysteinase